MQYLNRILQTLFWIGVYAAFGMAGYSQFVGDLIDPMTAQFWAWLGAWPAMLVILLITPVLKWAAIIIGVAAAILFIIWFVGTMSLLRKNRRQDKDAAHD